MARRGCRCVGGPHGGYTCPQCSGSAVVVGLTPSDEFVPPVLNLDNDRNCVCGHTASQHEKLLGRCLVCIEQVGCSYFVRRVGTEISVPVSDDISTFDDEAIPGGCAKCRSSMKINIRIRKTQTAVDTEIFHESWCPDGTRNDS